MKFGLHKINVTPIMWKPACCISLGTIEMGISAFLVTYHPETILLSLQKNKQTIEADLMC